MARHRKPPNGGHLPRSTDRVRPATCSTRLLSLWICFQSFCIPCPHFFTFPTSCSVFPFHQVFSAGRVTAAPVGDSLYLHSRFSRLYGPCGEKCFTPLWGDSSFVTVPIQNQCIAFFWFQILLRQGLHFITLFSEIRYGDLIDVLWCFTKSEPW